MPKDLAIPMAFPDCRARSDEINSDVPSGHAKAASESVSRDPVIVGFQSDHPAMPGQTKALTTRLQVGHAREDA